MTYESKWAKEFLFIFWDSQQNQVVINVLKCKIILTSALLDLNSC